MTCWASAGTVTSTPSSRTFLFQVSMRKNQLSGGRVGGAAEEGGDEEIVRGLGGGEVGV